MEALLLTISSASTSIALCLSWRDAGDFAAHLVDAL